jgi:hypothetical protein
VQHNTSTTGQIFCNCQIMGKIREYKETVHELFIDLRKEYDLARNEVLYNIIDFGVPMKSVSLIEMCSSETFV